MRVIERVTTIALLLSTTWLVGCDDESSEPEETCRDYAELTPGGSFQSDVMPLFERSCALATSCHQGNPGDGQEGLGLGPNRDMGPADDMTRDLIHDELLNQAAVRSSLPHVSSSDPAGSWLMNKIEYGGDDLAMCSQCTDCGGFMPLGSPPTSGFSREERDTIAAWILDGAQNN